jgi:SAM-dependent methyltransferase
VGIPAFTAHNIGLDDGTWTLPGTEPTAGNAVCQAALRLLREHVPGEPAQLRVADLGALEAGYAVAFARAGYQAVAVEARPRNMETCRYVASRVSCGIELICDDARNLPSWGEFDAVFCCGLLYHLDRPAEFLRMLGTVTRRLLILQTHYSLHPDAENEGLPGHWYDEGTESAWSAWGNQRSFWLTEDALLGAIADAGFNRAAREPDGVLHDAPDRAMFSGVKP